MGAAATNVEAGPPAWMDPGWWSGLLEHVTLSLYVAACIFMILAGVAFLLWGFRLYRWLVVLAFVAIGIVLGMWAADYFRFNQSVGIIVGAILLGVPAWPLYRVACGVLGGAAFAIILTAVATYIGLEGEVAQIALAAVAFVAGAALTILLLKPIIIIGTALDGAYMLIQGVVALAALWPPLGNPVLSAIRSRPYVPLVGILLLAVAGAIMQFLDTSKQKKKKKPADGD